MSQIKEKSADYQLTDLAPVLKAVEADNILLESLPVWLSTQTRKSAGRGRSADNTRQYGVQNLRELILELAVRGKLAPQDPNEEPASMLLEKITKEKARLFKEGKIKKQKSQAAISEDEKPYLLPTGWVWTCLGSICQINPRNEADDQTIVSFVPMSLVTSSHTGEHDQETRIWKEVKSGYTHFADGDVAIAKITPCFENGKAAFFQNLKNGLGAGTTELHVARPYGQTLYPRYILIYLKAPQFLVVGESRMTGTAGQKRVPKEFFTENPLPLPPLAEQHRIVKKVDELMALCDQLEQQQADAVQAHDTLVNVLLDTLTQSENVENFQQSWRRIAEYFDTLFTTESSIDQLKQTLLQLAVMGKLVPQDPNDEPASILLEKIAEEKAQQVKEGNIKKSKPLQEVNDDKLPHLPNAWSWQNLGNLILIMDAGWSPACPPEPSKNHEEWGVLKTTAVQVMQYLEFENKRLPPPKAPKEQYEVKDGDILITRAGPKNRVGISCVVEKTRPRLMISDKLIRFHLIPTGMSERYICLCLNAGKSNEYLEAAKSGMAESQMNISQDKLKLTPIPVSPVNEQHRIVKKVDELMALCDQLKDRLNQAQTLQQQLADAVVETTLNTF